MLVADLYLFLEPPYKRLCGCLVSVVDEDKSFAAPGQRAFTRRAGLSCWKRHKAALRGGPQAMADLCTRYWPPLYVFARGRGRGPEDAHTSRASLSI
jgi:hypothetical protein